MIKSNSIDDYIDNFPEQTQKILKEVRQIIKESAPQATEDIRYGMPTFRLNNKNLVHFAAFKNHLGFYPTPSGVSAFENQLSQYSHAKGSIQFPLNQPIPLELISNIVKFRVKEVLSD